MTRRVAPEEQGQLQGALSALAGIAGLIGPAMFTLTFAHFISEGAMKLPGAPMILSAVLLAVAGVVALGVTREPSVERATQERA